MTRINPLVAALFLTAAFIAAGAVHSAWLASAASRGLKQPIDGGLTLRGRRLFGDNKTVRGFIVMPPAVGAFFWLFAFLLESFAPESRASLWPLTGAQLAVLGTWAGLGFMLGELPNSFIKRQLEIDPGAPATGPVAAFVAPIMDRLDSVFGTLIAISIATPTPLMTWAYVLLLAPVPHLLFSVLLYKLGVKARRA